MAKVILSNEGAQIKRFSSIIGFPLRTGEYSMKKKSGIIKDVVTAKQRLKTPLSYKWLKFKTNFFGINPQRPTIYCTGNAGSFICFIACSE